MAGIKNTRLDKTTDERRRLAKVVFTPLVPDPANQFDVEAVFEVVRPGMAHLDGDPYAIVMLSATRVDTREPYVLSEEQRDTVIDAALVSAAEEDGQDW